MVAIMPTAALDVVAGDPPAVAAAGRTLASIADEVARHSAKLRSLASSASGWTGKAATGAYARSATLPPKLDKVTASYGSAGRTLLGYARALADAQQRSSAAVMAANRADAELQSARAAQANAAIRDSQAVKAAMAAGQPAPSPTAPRYQASIDEAATRLARAEAANAQAHADRDHSSAIAAAGLKAASHAGIHNQSWWQHFQHSVAHWTSTHWRDALATLSGLAGQISILASIAAVVLAAGGMFFPPLEAAAAIAQGVAVVSGVAANLSATVVEVSDKRTRNDGLLSLGMLFVPGAASKLIRRMPLLPHSGLFSATEQAEERAIPLGFANDEDFATFGATLRSGLDEAGHADTVAVMKGSSVTGFKYESGAPFDEGVLSDYDIALCGGSLFNTAKDAGAELRGKATRTAPLSEKQLGGLGLDNLSARLAEIAGREVHFMIYVDVDRALRRGPSIRFPQ
jgi:hypothetical protein